MLINLLNAEELLFFNKKVFEALPQHINYYYQWRMAQMSPALKNIGKKAVADFINLLNNKEVEILEKLFEEKIVLEKFNKNSVINTEFSINDTENQNLCEYYNYSGFAITMNKDRVAVTFWR